MAAASFSEAFSRARRRVRVRLAARRALDGAALGAGLAAVGALALWYARLAPERAHTWFVGATGLCLAGAAAGLAVARAKRWSDRNVALFLDARLGSREAITTALELGGLEASDAPRGTATGSVLAQAEQALAAPSARLAAPRVWHRWQLGIALGLASVAGVRLLPLPPAPEPPAPPAGAELVRLADLKGVEKLAELEHVKPRDEAQKKRLDKLLDDAKRLREKLAEGMEKREAQSELAKLVEGIAAERLSLGAGEERAGLEAALGKLAESKQLTGVERALGDRDLVSMDDEMQRLANQLESEDRQRAHDVLREAAEAARKAKAPGVAKALEEQAKRLAEQGERMEALRELSEAIEKHLPEHAKEAAKELARSGDPKAARELSEALAEALSKLSPEERERLAKELAKRADETSQQEGTPGSEPQGHELQKLADELATEEGRKRLEEQLRELAKGTPPSEEAERQKQLAQAEGAAGGGAIPIPAGGGGSNSPSAQGTAGKSTAGGSPGSETAGGQSGAPSPGGGSGSSSGPTAKVEAPGFTSKADGKLGAGKLMPGGVLGRATGRPGETANVRGTGGLGDARATEVGGVQRSDVPREYREQVGRYFDPK